MSRPDSRRIEVGVITSAHGIRGQVKLRSFTDTPEDIAALGPLTDDKGKAYKITLHGGNEKALIASVEGITDRNEAELLKSTVLYADAANIQENPHASLIGKDVQTPNGEAYGTITHVYNFGAGDVVEIKKTDGELEMLPLNESFVEINKLDHIIIHPPEYLEASSSRAAKRRGDPENH